MKLYNKLLYFDWEEKLYNELFWLIRKKMYNELFWLIKKKMYTELFW